MFVEFRIKTEIHAAIKKLKCTLVQALRLCTDRTAHRGSRGIALLFHERGTRRGWGVSVTPRPLFTPGKDSVPIVQEAGWAPGPVWTGAENLAPAGIQTPDRPARSQSLYRLRYTAPTGIRTPDRPARSQSLYRLRYTQVNYRFHKIINCARLCGRWMKCSLTGYEICKS